MVTEHHDMARMPANAVTSCVRDIAVKVHEAWAGTPRFNDGCQ